MDTGREISIYIYLYIICRYNSVLDTLKRTDAFQLMYIDITNHTER